MGALEIAVISSRATHQCKTHREKVIAAPHQGAVMRRATSKGKIMIGAFEPPQACCLIGKEDFQSFVRTKRKRYSFKLVAVENSDLAILLVVIGLSRNIAE